MFKKGDIVIIATILLISVFTMYLVVYRGKSLEKIIEVVYDNEVVASYRIDDSFEGRYDFFDGKGGHEVYWIHDGGVEVIESNTPQKICMKMGFIDKDGQMIVALPHRMYITVKSVKSEKDPTSLDAIVK